LTNRTLSAAVTVIQKISPETVSAPMTTPEGTENWSRAPLAAQRSLQIFDRVGLPYSLRELETAPSTPEALAEQLETEIDFIVLSTMYRGKATRKPILLLHSAATRVSDKLLCQLVGENVQRADGDFIMRYTGFSIDCVPPVGHLNRVPLILDSSITRLARVWCNTGAPGCYASVPSLVLARVISARLVRLTV
jgi:prolyl-tRNA editing enzyme YbaK/EbsC (Cys-tRNA(Pro) deacylase)